MSATCECGEALWVGAWEHGCRCWPLTSDPEVTWTGGLALLACWLLRGCIDCVPPSLAARPPAPQRQDARGALLPVQHAARAAVPGAGTHGSRVAAAITGLRLPGSDAPAGGTCAPAPLSSRPAALPVNYRSS